MTRTAAWVPPPWPGTPFWGAVKSIEPESSLNDGPIGERATGHSILEAASLGVATEMAKGCPILQCGGRLAVYQIFNVM